jgi:hypothetical protein
MLNVCRTDFPLKCFSKNKRGKEKWNFYHPKTLQLELFFFFPRRTRAFLLNDRKMSRLEVESEKDVSREKSETRVFIESMCVTVCTMYFGFDDLMGAQRAYEKLLTRQWSNQSVYKQILEERKNLFIRRIKILCRKEEEKFGIFANMSNIDVTKSSASFYTWAILVMRPPSFS